MLRKAVVVVVLAQGSLAGQVRDGHRWPSPYLYFFWGACVVVVSPPAPRRCERFPGNVATTWPRKSEVGKINYKKLIKNGISHEIIKNEMKKEKNELQE